MLIELENGKYISSSSKDNSFDSFQECIASLQKVLQRGIVLDKAMQSPIAAEIHQEISLPGTCLKDVAKAFYDNLERRLGAFDGTEQLILEVNVKYFFEIFDRYIVKGGGEPCNRLSKIGV